MITCIREVRRAKGLSLLEVAQACDPPTTAQTIGRLETGTRTVSLPWLNRIAAALGVSPADLVRKADAADLPVIALIDREGARAPAKPLAATAPLSDPGTVALLFEQSVGDYRTRDTVWAERLTPDAFARALNHDIVVPRSGGRLLFGRMIGLEQGRLLLLPLTSGARQTVVTDAPWLAVARRLVREL